MARKKKNKAYVNYVAIKIKRYKYNLVTKHEYDKKYSIPLNEGD